MDDAKEETPKSRKYVQRRLMINGTTYDYPDVMAITTSDNKLMFETKGDHLDNNESKAKTEIGHQWAMLLG